MNKRLLVGLGCMLVGATLVVLGLLKIPALPVVLILMGGTLGFVGYKIYEKRNEYQKPNDLIYG